MRTDSTYLSKDAIHATRALLGSEFGSNYLPETPNFYASRDNAQEAHEAISPQMSAKGVRIFIRLNEMRKDYANSFGVSSLPVR